MLLREYLAKYLGFRKLKHVFGVSGANIEDLFFELSKIDGCTTVLSKSEGQAGLMSMGHYLATREITAALTTSGAGLMNIIPALAESHSSQIPFVLISGLIPEDLEGLGGFQDTSGKGGSFDAASALSPMVGYLKKIRHPNQIRSALTRAFMYAEKYRKPSAILIPKNLFNQEIQVEPPAPHLQITKQYSREVSLVKSWMESSSRKTLIVLGEELIHLKDRTIISRFANSNGSLVAVTPHAKGLFDNHHDSYVGLTGIMGNSSVDSAMMGAEDILLLGTRFDAMSRFGHEEQMTGKRILALSSSARELISLPFLKGGVFLEGDIEQILQEVVSSEE